MTNFEPPETPLPEDINRSKQNPLYNLLNLVVSVAMIFAVFYGVSWGLSQLLASQLSFENEKKYFAKWFGPKKELLNNDKDVTKLTNTLWKSLQGEPKEYFDIEFNPSLISGDPNAFMAPGGNMFIAKSLIEQSDSENELAFVICHELGHFYHRHNVKRLINGLFVGAFHVLTGQGGGSTFELSDLGQTFALNTFSQTQETQADEFALRCMNDMYGHVNAHDAFFKKIQKEESLLEKFYGHTHPLTKSRIHHLLTVINSKGYDVSGDLTPLTQRDPESQSNEY